MTYLPIDYYILLQGGYEKPKNKKVGGPQDKQNRPMMMGTNLPRSNIILFNNLPVLHKKQTTFNKNNKIIKSIRYEDIMRSLDKDEAKDMLTDRYAENEMKRLLLKKFGGSITKLSFIGYRPDPIISRFHNTLEDNVQIDHMGEF